MIGFVLRCVAMLYLCGFELVLVERTQGLAPDLVVAWVCFAAFRLQPSSAWQILLPLAFARTAFFPGNVAMQLAFVLSGYLAAMSLRSFIVPERWQTQMLVAFALACLFSSGRGLLLSADGLDPMRMGWFSCLLTAVTTPGLMLLAEPFAGRLRRAPATILISEELPS